VGAAAVFAGLIGLVGLPWPISLSASLLLAACVLIGDTIAFGRPAPITKKSGKALVLSLGAFAVLIALVIAFMAGQWSAQFLHSASYQFIVTGGVTPVRALPSDQGGTVSVVEGGDTVYVECGIKYENGSIWYRLSNSSGWLKDSDMVQAPYTGRGSPPECPR
jgi:hypothetical protein